MWSDFKKFIMTGNVIDFAIAVILAGVIGGVVNGFVTDIASPIIGAIANVPDLSALKIQLSEDVLGPDGKVATPGAAIMWGKWLSSIISLIITGLVLFMIVKAKERAIPPAPPALAGPSDNDLLIQIRDLLKK